MEVSLYNSTVCRLCGEENDNGSLLYSSEENNQDLCELINVYLPLKVSDDGQLPRTICPGCTIQLEATVEFLNLIINGQKVIRQLHQREKEYKSNVFGNPSKEVEVVTETVIYEKTGDTIYPDDHPLALQVGGLEKPKRKRGRPPKKNKPTEEIVQEPIKQIEREERQDLTEDSNGKRRRKTPTRFKEVIQGKELERIFIEEGVTDGEESDSDSKQEVKQEITPPPPVPREPEVIGHMENSGELVVVVKGKGRGRPKGRVRQTREECAICGMEFSCVGRYMSHVAQHGRVLYRCSCGRAFGTRLLFTQHQAQTGHQGQTVIPCDDAEGAANQQPPATVKEPPKEPKDPLESANTIKIDPSPAPEAGLPDLNPVKIYPEKSSGDVKVEPAVTTASDEVTHAAATGVMDEDEEVVIDDEEVAPVKEEGVSKPKLKCHNCDKVFSSKQSRSLHNKAVHLGEKPYACGECGARFAYPRSLTLHALSHRRRPQPARGFACDLCGKVLNHPSSVVYHKAAEHAGQRFVCSKCGKGFKHKQLLTRHQLVHSQLRPFTCNICNSSFKTKANLINHTLLHTGVKKFSCEICKHKFAHKTSLTLHMRWHTGQKPFSCGKCGKSFSQKGNLSEHERIHTGEKPYSCDVCGRRFTTSSQHRLHARRHTDDKPYACSVCDKRFVSRASWAAHLRREQGAGGAGGARGAGGAGGGGAGGAGGAGGPHACPVCARGFNERWALRKHMRRHTGERPHRCPHCPKAFADASNLNKHKKQVHKQISLLVKDQGPNVTNGTLAPSGTLVQPGTVLAPSPDTLDSDDDERVIYVAYDVEDDSPAYHILGPEQVAAAGIQVDEQSPNSAAHTLYAQQLLRPPLLLPQVAPQSPRQDHLPVTDEEGNPLHFTMEDGTQLAITLADGKSLQIVTQDGQTIPVEINRYNEEVEEEVDTTEVQQFDVQKTVEASEPAPVTHYFTIV